MSPRAPKTPVLNRAQTMQSDPSRCYKCEVKAKRYCAVCRKPVCKKHFLKRKVHPESDKPTRICEDCCEGQVRLEGKNDLEQQKQRLLAEIDNAKSETSQLDKRIEEAKTLKQRLIDQIQKVKEQTERRDSELQAKLKKVVADGDIVRQEIDAQQSVLNECNAKEREMNEKSAGMEKELDSLRKEAITLRDEKADLLRTLQDIDQKEKSSIPLAHLKAIACPVCKKRLDDTYRPRRSMAQESLTASRTTHLGANIPPRPPAEPQPSLPSSRGCGKSKDCQLM